MQGCRSLGSRLAADLRQHVGRKQVVPDFSSIDLGADFVEAVQRGLDTCAAVLVVIGPKWLSVVNADGGRRVDADGDWVSYEVAESLRRPGVRVFPVLVDGAEMPLPRSYRVTVSCRSKSVRAVLNKRVSITSRCFISTSEARYRLVCDLDRKSTSINSPRALCCCSPFQVARSDPG